MSQPVRQKLRLPSRSGRRPEQRVGILFPWFADLWLWLTARLSPESRLRRALFLRATEGAFDALNRRDFDSVLLGYHPDVRIERGSGSTDDGELGFQETYEGHDGYREFQRDWLRDWAELRYEPDELIDLGDRFLVLMEATAVGEASGAAITEEWAVLATFNRQGKIIREQRYFDQAEALEAVGL